jgi:intein/homing endonuclease
MTTGIGTRYLEMEKDCISENTAISGGKYGLSFNIEDLENLNIDVLGWNQEKNGMKPSKQTQFLAKGERECLDIYLEDGRKLTCTPDHKILTAENEWVKAKDLTKKEIRVKCSVKYPLISVYEEITQCNNWSLKVSDNLTLKTDTFDEYMKTLAFARILGYILADGSICKSNNTYRTTIFMGHQIDLENILKDLKLFTTIKQKKFENKNLYRIQVPTDFTKNLLQIKGIMTGARVKQHSTLPEFLLDANCPLPLIREFIAGLFGGDGHTCNISKNTFTYISFSQSKVIGHLDSLKAMMEQIKKWLALFDIKGVTLQEPKINSASKKRIEDDKKNYEIVLHLNKDELIPFYEKIGFRYCCHKNQRMEAAVAYTRLRDGVLRQKKWIINRVNELTNYKAKKIENSKCTVSTSNAIIQATDELTKKEPILHKFAIPSCSDIKEYLVNNREGGRIPSSVFPTSTQFLESIGASSWFSKCNAKQYESKKKSKNNTEEETAVDDIPENNANNANVIANDVNYGVSEHSEVLPTMNLKVIDIRPGGVHPVYDIQVDKEESFLANGVVAHNCLIAHGVMGFMKERMMDVSDKFTVYICKECGLFSIVNPNDDGERKCGGCENYSEFMELRIPYACKLLMQELEGMMITPRFNLPKPNI